MASVRDVAEGIKLLGDVVKSTREIVRAVNDGKDYLKTRFPDAQKDLVDLLSQMEITIIGLANVTKIISAFRFVYDSANLDLDTASRELVRFNDYIIAQKVHVEELKKRIGPLKADCEKVRKLRDELDARAKTQAWGSMFGLLGAKAEERSDELHRTLSHFYADDEKMIALITTTLGLAEHAIEDVNNELGPPGMAHPYNLPSAANLLGFYAKVFESPKDKLNELAMEFAETKKELDK